MHVKICEYYPTFVELGDYKPKVMEFNSVEEMFNSEWVKSKGGKFDSHGYDIYVVKGKVKSKIASLIKGDVGEIREYLESINGIMI